MVVAKGLAKSFPRDNKKISLMKSNLPDAMKLMDENLDTKIYDPIGE